MAEWVAIGVTVLGGLIGFVGTWIKLGARMDSAEDKLKEHDGKHDDHYKHAAKSDAHWTGRERNDLDRRVDEMSADIKELLRRNGGPRG